LPTLIARRAPITGELTAPASKPETQRALVMGALGSGTTVIHRPLIAREIQVMMEACRALGAAVDATPERLRVTGIDAANAGRGTRHDCRVWSAGSALVARTFLAIGAGLPGRVVIDGNPNLKGRPFAPLLGALQGKGVGIDFLEGAGRLPFAARSSSLPGGTYRLETQVSSQFATALLVASPLASDPLAIELVGPAYSLSYIRQTLDMMARFGVAAEVDEGLGRIAVPHGRSYRAQRVELTGDFTSASYVLGAAFVTRGHIKVANLDPASLQGERAIVAILEALGARIRWHRGNVLEIDCTAVPAAVDAAIDLADSPNILPTVAAGAAPVGGRVRITGARLTQNHKSPRIEAMAAELGRAGVALRVLHDAAGAIDGLEIRGRRHHAGGVAFGSHGDHRIFMSLVLFALACDRACVFADGESTLDSFPGFAAALDLDDVPLQGAA